MSLSCGICGDVVPSRVDAHAHLKTHSFAEVLRFEIRQDLDQVPEDQRPTIVRDIYRSLLGKNHDTTFVLDDADGLGVYSIEDVLGTLDVYRLWRTANRCGEPRCGQHQTG